MKATFFGMSDLDQLPVEAVLEIAETMMAEYKPDRSTVEQLLSYAVK